MITPITNHVDAALARLLTQYGDKSKVRALVASMVTPIQEIEDVLEELNTLRSIDTATGVQLDGLGSIVGIDRNGLSDDDYRFWIKAKVLINVSEGEPEIVLEVFRLLTEATTAQISENFPGGVSLSSDGTIQVGKENLVAQLVKSALAAGVRLDSMAHYDASNPFSFDGPVGPQGGGFGTLADGALGGEFASLYVWGKDFGMAGDDASVGGFGSLEDVTVGGKFAG